MDEDYPVTLLSRMLEIYSPSGHEKEMSEFLAGEMKRLGYDVEVDEVGNVLGRVGSGLPKVLLCGHMDTVEGFIEVKRRGKVIFGRGAVDAKSSLAAFICGAKRYVELGGKGTISVLAVVDEEGKSEGMKHYLSRTSETFDFAVFGEPSGAYSVTIGYKGRIVFSVECTTAPGHASAPQLFENSIYVAIRLIDKLRSMEAEWERVGEIFDMPTMCVTLINGGSQDNTIPGRCEFSVDVRVPPSRDVYDLKGRIAGVIEDFKVGEKRATIRYDFKDENMPFVESEDSVMVRAFRDSIMAVKGRECKLIKKTGTSDVNEFVKKFRIPTVVYGPGNSRLDHTPNENISIEEYGDSIEVIARALMNLSQG
ncbi:MAG: M20/M25/M40 family metallo-hydrolase [Candidatus Methanomethylicia archaeon]|nr:M20/M25/M40 family metallo-hydrolase [Candidatus Methanomethylicia archaeon]